MSRDKLTNGWQQAPNKNKSVDISYDEKSDLLESHVRALI